MIAGLHEPLTLFNDVVGKAGITLPEQYSGTWAKLGTVWGVIFIVIDAVVAHSFTFGVKVYEPVVVLLIAGLHEPEILFWEVVGKAGIFEPEQ